jgi:hypothetical protein
VRSDEARRVPALALPATYYPAVAGVNALVGRALRRREFRSVKSAVFTGRVKPRSSALSPTWLQSTNQVRPGKITIGIPLPGFTRFITRFLGGQKQGLNPNFPKMTYQPGNIDQKSPYPVYQVYYPVEAKMGKCNAYPVLL